MLDAFIPNSEDELRALENIAQGGFVIGFGLRYGSQIFSSTAIQTLGLHCTNRKITFSVIL